MATVHSSAVHANAGSDTEISDQDIKPKDKESAGPAGNVMDDLFGDDDDSDVEKQTPAGGLGDQDQVGDDTMADADRAPDSTLSPEEQQRRKALEYAEEDEQEEIHLKEAKKSIPAVPKPRSSDGNFWCLRLPNFLKIDSRPFHPTTYIGPDQYDDDGGVSARERSMSIKLQVENTIRWRWSKDEAGNDIKQSNARVIRWSDGSKTLLLGKEQFEIQETIDNSATVSRQAIGGTQSTPALASSSSSTRTQGLTYLVTQHANSGILQTEAPVTGTVTLKPIGMQSETHRMLVRAVGQKHNKVARLRLAPDPVRDLEKEKAELLKSQTKKPRKRRDRDDDEPGTPARKRSYGRKRMAEHYMSDEDGDGWGSGSDEESTPKKRGGRKDTGEYQTGDFVVSDEEDDEEEETPKKRRKARSGSDEGDEGDEKDVLDEMDERIEKDHASKKRKKKVPISEPIVEEPKEEEDKEEEMVEVESEERDEEEEEEEKIRRVGSGIRRKRVLEEEEEE